MSIPDLSGPRLEANRDLCGRAPRGRGGGGGAWRPSVDPGLGGAPVDPLRLRSAGCCLEGRAYACPRIGQNVTETQVIVAPQTVARLGPRREHSITDSRPCSPGSPPPGDRPQPLSKPSSHPSGASSWAQSTANPGCPRCFVEGPTLPGTMTLPRTMHQRPPEHCDQPDGLDLASGQREIPRERVPVRGTDEDPARWCFRQIVHSEGRVPLPGFGPGYPGEDFFFFF